MRDKEWRVLTFMTLLSGALKFRSSSSPKISLQLFEEVTQFIFAELISVSPCQAPKCYFTLSILPFFLVHRNV